MNQRNILLTASVLGLFAVGLGAFGAHALKATLTMTGRADTYELAVRYQFYHTLVLLAIGILIEKYPSLKTSSIFFVIGIIIFSGSLYILALTNQTLWGAVTPIGGVFLMAGWLWSGWVFLKNTKIYYSTLCLVKDPFLVHYLRMQ